MAGAHDDEDNNFMDTNYKVGFWQIYLLGTPIEMVALLFFSRSINSHELFNGHND